MRIFRHMIGQEFQCDIAMKPCVLSLIDHTHTALAHSFEDVVVRDDLTDQLK